MKLVEFLYLIISIFLSNYQVSSTPIEQNETHMVSGLNSFINETIEKINTILLSISPVQGYKLIIPKECEQFGICERIPNYPQEFVTRIIEMLLKQNIKLNVDPMQELLNNTTKTVTETMELCPSELRPFYPLAVQDTDNKWYLVLNSEKYPQRFIGEQCKKNLYEEKTCSKIASFPNNYHGVCIQKFIKRKIIVLDTRMERVVEIVREFPSCCTCVVVRE